MRKLPGSPYFYVLQATKSWAGPGDEAMNLLQRMIQLIARNSIPGSYGWI